MIHQLTLAAAALVALAGIAQAQEARDFEFLSTTAPALTEHRAAAPMGPRERARGEAGGFGAFSAAQTARTLGY